MIPNIHLHEHFMFEHHKELLREMEQQRLLARLPRHRFKLAGRLAAMVGGFLIECGASLKRFEPSEEQAVYDR